MNKESFYAFREKGAQSKFQSFALEIVSGCQLECGNCYRAPQKKIDPMSSDFISRMIMEAKESGFAEIVFIGGEPTLHPNLSKLLEKSLSEGLNPILCTNGVRLANKKYCERVVLDGMTVVIHGIVQAPGGIMDRHVNVHGYKDKLQAAYDNLNELRKHRDFTIVAEAVVIKPFLPHLLAFHKSCREEGYIPFIEFNRRGNNGCRNGLSASPEEVIGVFSQLQEWDLQNMPELADGLLTPPAYGNKCTMSITGLHVKNLGDGNFSGVYSCCAQTVCHGDLQEKTLREIIADPSIQIYKNQDKWIAGPCRDCDHYPICRGGCRGEATLTFGCPRASCPACWNIPPDVRHDPSIMMPATCVGCPLEHDTGCGKR
jgi:radical SAM protein with 4Fe4S-binding SPASM domain